MCYSGLPNEIEMEAEDEVVVLHRVTISNMFYNHVDITYDVNRNVLRFRGVLGIVKRFVRVDQEDLDWEYQDDHHVTTRYMMTWEIDHQRSLTIVSSVEMNP